MFFQGRSDFGIGAGADHALDYLAVFQDIEVGYS
jgi:hypothetical protein